jgi:hypothetical protein
MIYSIYKTHLNLAVKSSFGVAKILLNDKQNSRGIIQRIFLRQGDRPNAKAFGASGSQVTPDSSARPAGLRLFLVSCKYTLPHIYMSKDRFPYTGQYTWLVNSIQTSY